jgi:hypothetical protein
VIEGSSSWLDANRTDWQNNLEVDDPKNVGSGMKELAEALKLIFGKIGDFLDVFDLSFIVSGALGFSALFLWAEFINLPLPIGIHGGVQIFLIVFACYVNGMIFFAAGRFIRRTFSTLFPGGIAPGDKGKKFDELFLNIMQAHGLADQEPFKLYIDRTQQRGIWRLYVRLWAEVRQVDRLAPSFLLLRRYWIMAATYDGLAVALALWIVFIGRWLVGFKHAPVNISWEVAIPLIICLAVFATACLAESGRYLEYQIEELVASIAAERSRAEYPSSVQRIG